MEYVKERRIKTTLKTPQATLEFGELLGKYLMAGDVVALIGDLGIGKTQLVKGLARGVGVPEEYCITSPTYTIVNEYQGRIPLYHFDLYRLEGNSDMENLGYEEYFEGKGVAVIEWAEKITHLLPENRMEIRIGHLENDFREFEIIGFGDHYSKIVDEVVRFLP
ncbi:MAG: ATP-binding protein [bacterium]|nr:MAG: ATP-binding protein [bacterium]